MPPTPATTSVAEVCHAQEFREGLHMLADAAIAVYAIKTREPFRALYELNVFAVEAELPFKVWTILTGWQTFATQADGSISSDYTVHSTKDDTVSMQQALEKVRSEFSDGCYVIFGGHYTLDDPAIQQHIKNLTQHCLDNRKRIIFVFPDTTSIPSAIEDDIHLLDFKAPSFAELKVSWEREMNNIESEYKPTFSEEDTNLILRSALGMSQQEFSNAIAIALVALGDKLRDATIQARDFVRIILENKMAIIKRTDILELMPEASIDEIGGLDKLKEWLSERSAAMTSEEARAFGIDPPKGMLLVGPPGGGKSQIAKATAALMGVAGIKFDVGRVFGSLVGQSEERTRRALALIDAMAPVVLLVDEVDKGLGGIGGGGGDSGTSQRVLGTILTWMQDRQGPPVFLMFTANNVVGLPPELMRKGRLDEIFAVTFPGEVERAAIVKIHVEKRNHDMDDVSLRKIAKVTQGFVGAELEGLVKEGLIKQYNGMKKGDNLPLIDHMLELAETTTPLSKAFEVAVKQMNDWAKNNAKPASRSMTFDQPVQGAAPTIQPPGQKSRLIRRAPTGPLRPRGVSN